MGIEATSPWVLPLAAAGESPLSLVGGKARGLGALLAGGFVVPEGVVVTAAACGALLEAAGVAGEPAELARRSRAPAEGDEEGWLSGVRARIEAGPIPPALADALRGQAASLLEGGSLAVRSSGALEDLPNASFAGQYRSLLGVQGERQVLAAIQACVSSLFEPRITVYLRGLGGAPVAPRMAVVVQRQVDPDTAGVLFTVNPVSGRETEQMIEAVFGHGEPLVSGTARVDRFVVDAASGVAHERRLEAVPPAGLAGPTLDEEALRELAELGAAVQEQLGFPVDVEWVRSGGRFQLVQARPITALSFAPELGEWTTADFRDGGVSSDVCAPFMWSLYEAAFDRSMPRYFEAIGLASHRHVAKWSRMFFARPYWNLGEARGMVLKLPGFVERNFDLDLGITPAYEGPGRVTPTTLRTVLPAIPVLVKLHLEYGRRRRRNARFLSTFDAWVRPFDRPAGELRGLAPGRFLSDYRTLIETVHLETETSYFETIYNTSNTKLDFKVSFEKAARAAQARGRELDYATLVGGLLDLSHLRTLVDLHQVIGTLVREGRPLDDATVAAFAGRWPHRSRKELDLSAPRWPEDLPFVRGLMEQGLECWTAEADPGRIARARHDAYVAEREAATSALGPLARASFRAGLRRLRAFTWEREEMRDRSSRVYAFVRHWTKEAGRRLAAAGALAEAEDVWMLRREEVLGGLHGSLPSEALRARAQAGRRPLRSFRNFENPNEIGSSHGYAPRAAAAGERVLRGAACSPGIARGPARVVRRIEESARIRPGDVLVAPFTDPGWTPVFPRLAAVVTETGGLLSHAAVIARECGIPAVLAVPNATRSIPDGAPVEVDGHKGTVHLT